MIAPIAVWLSAHIASTIYPVSPDVLLRLAWVESHYVTAAVAGSHHGAWQVSTRWSRFTARQLHNPLSGALEAARLLAWARRHCGGDGLHWYRTGRCGGGR